MTSTAPAGAVLISAISDCMASCMLQLRAADAEEAFEYRIICLMPQVGPVACTSMELYQSQGTGMLQGI